jgi:hypothetical protein
MITCKIIIIAVILFIFVEILLLSSLIIISRIFKFYIREKLDFVKFVWHTLVSDRDIEYKTDNLQ